MRIGTVVAAVTTAMIILNSCVSTVAGIGTTAAPSAPTVSTSARPTGLAPPTAVSTPVDQKNGQIGGEVRFDDYFVGTVKKILDLAASDDGFPADNGKRYVGVEVDITNSSGNAEIFAPLLQAELKDPAGKTYYATPTSGHKPEAPNGEIPPKQTASGMMVFEIPSRYSFGSGRAPGFTFLFKGVPGGNADGSVGLG